MKNAIEEYLAIKEEDSNDTTFTRKQFFCSAANLMDDDICQSIHDDLGECTEEEYLAEYCTRHKAQYGTDFIVN